MLPLFIRILTNWALCKTWNGMDWIGMEQIGVELFFISKFILERIHLQTILMERQIGLCSCVYKIHM